MQWLQFVVIKQRKIWESIIVIVAFDLLHNNFKIIIVILLYSSDKDFE